MKSQISESRFCESSIGKDRCGAYKIKGKRFCFIHDPESADKRALARRQGGLNRKRKIESLAVMGFQVRDVESAEALLKFLCNEVAQGRISVNQVKGVNSLIRTLLDCFWLRLKTWETTKDARNLAYLNKLRKEYKGFK